MIEQLIVWSFLLLLPYEITVVEPDQARLEEIRQQILQVEVDTRAWRQKRSGQGL